ncbi:50S ribosomal protein L4 [Candidatus Sumerlaeota bacterium]|nr:50S ribosomal protein L4 [Candidatus Sumerlaeota bacterium]
MKTKKQTGAAGADFELSPAVFEADQNAVLVREVYTAWMTNQRQGTHSTKTRAHVRGGGKKPWKQKHTGRARQGSTRAPQWRGGAIIFGPLPRDYHEKVNKKKRSAAFRAVLSSKLTAGEIIVVDALDFQKKSDVKTKNVVEMLEKVGAKGKTLIVVKERNEGLSRAAGNLAGSAQTPTRVTNVDAISIYDLLVAQTLLITGDALTALQERLAK